MLMVALLPVSAKSFALIGLILRSAAAGLVPRTGLAGISKQAAGRCDPSCVLYILHCDKLCVGRRKVLCRTPLPDPNDAASGPGRVCAPAPPRAPARPSRRTAEARPRDRSGRRAAAGPPCRASA